MFTIYGLYEAGKPDEIRYVGATGRSLAKRWRCHLTDSRKRRHPVNVWVSRTLRSGITIECRTIQRVKDALRVSTIEKKWITYYARKGSLLNVYDNPTVVRNKDANSIVVKSKIARSGVDEVVTNFLQYLRDLPM